MYIGSNSPMLSGYYLVSDGGSGSIESIVGGSKKALLVIHAQADLTAVEDTNEGEGWPMPGSICP
jgi:hypothetical protein